MGRVLIATTYGDGSELVDIDPNDIAAGLSLLEPANETYNDSRRN